jgi:hypothetical protein
MTARGAKEGEPQAAVEVVKRRSNEMVDED